MGTTVKKAATKSGHANKSGTKKPAGHKPPARKPVAAARPSRAAKPSAAKKPKVTPLKSSPPKAAHKAPIAKAAPKAAAPKPVPKAPSPKALGPKPAEAPAIEIAPPAPPKPTPPKAVPPPPAIQAPPAPKPNLVKLSSLEPADAARLTAVRNLLEAQGRHDLPAILASFGSQPTLEFAGGPRHIGAERVGQIYGDLLRAFPDLTIEVLAEHVADRSIVVEMVLRGTHRQQWLGMAPRGRPLSLPVCNVFLFDKRDQISALRIYLDRNLAIVQLTSGLLR
ncbi:MAG TPA: nuclear transport factor 2 family protein [Dongiaceae bacterium]|jgi:hypothetical protein|nr:nuclear transport factor 2 family protein [Dongiaceae bacterium]